LLRGKFQSLHRDVNTVLSLHQAIFTREVWLSTKLGPTKYGYVWKFVAVDKLQVAS